MNKWVLAGALAGLFALSASANSLTIYFGRPEMVPPTTSFVGGPDPTLLQSDWAAGPVTLGIWANVQYDFTDPSYPVMDTWNGISINIVGVTVSNLTIDNFDHRLGAGTIRRWETTSDFGGGDNGFYLVAVNANGLGGELFPREFGFGNGATDWWTYTTGTAGTPGAVYHYWLGNVTIALDVGGAVWFQIGSGGISRLGGSTADWIYFGEGEPVGLHGNQFGAISSIPDFFEVPEPGGLVLMAAGALGLRRR